MWKEYGRPSDSYIADICRKTRRDYHYAIVKTLKNKEKIIKETVARSLSCGNPKTFWSQIQRINKSKNFSVDEVDGEKGVDACNVFKEKYKSCIMKILVV